MKYVALIVFIIGCCWLCNNLNNSIVKDNGGEVVKDEFFSQHKTVRYGKHLFRVPSHQDNIMLYFHDIHCECGEVSSIDSAQYFLHGFKD